MKILHKHYLHVKIHTKPPSTIRYHPITLIPSTISIRSNIHSISQHQNTRRNRVAGALCLCPVPFLWPLFPHLQLSCGRGCTDGKVLKNTQHWVIDIKLPAPPSILSTALESLPSHPPSHCVQTHILSPTTEYVSHLSVWSTVFVPNAQHMAYAPSSKIELGYRLYGI